MVSSATDVVSTPIPRTVSVTFVNLFRARKQRYLGDRSIDSGTSTAHHDKSAANKRLVDIIWYCWFNSHKCTVRTSELSAPTECLQLRLFCTTDYSTAATVCVMRAHTFCATLESSNLPMITEMLQSIPPDQEVRHLPKEETARPAVRRSCRQRL